MKKLIAVLAALALIVGSAFADSSWGGRVDIGAHLAAGDNQDGTDVVGHLRSSVLELELSGTRATDFGTFGGLLVVEWGAPFGTTTSFWTGGRATWQPMDMLWIGMGNVGMARLNNISRAGDNFHRGGAGLDRDIPGALGLHGAFFGGLGTGIILDLSPTSLVDIGVGLPYNWATDVEVSNIFERIHARARLNLDFGRIGIGYRGSAADGNNGIITATFHSATLVPGLALNLGVGFNMVEDAEVLNIGFGVGWGANEQFGVGFRGAVALAIGDNANLGGGAGNGVRMSFQAIPRFLVMPGVSVQLPLGVGVDMPDAGDTIIRFQVDPYVRVNLGRPAFLAGVNIDGNNDGGDMTVNWGVPIGMIFSF